jgi:hypothetical protein
MKKLVHFLSATVAVMLFLGFSVVVVQADSCSLPDFASAKFSNPTNINNAYLPWVPGTTFIYAPVPNPDNVVNPVIVTNKTKRITVDGKSIKCRGVHDFETDNGVLAEDTLDWYAQDDDGNVWYCGEDTSTYSYDQNGNLIGVDHTGSWEAGVDGALPGYVMLAAPSPGVCYQQEYLAGEAEDEAKIMALGVNVTLENNGTSYGKCLETKEWSPLELGDIEQKFYAPGVGLVLNYEHHGTIVRWELISVTPPPGAK